MAKSLWQFSMPNEMSIFFVTLYRLTTVHTYTENEMQSVIVLERQRDIHAWARDRIETAAVLP